MGGSEYRKAFRGRERQYGIDEDKTNEASIALTENERVEPERFPKEIEGGLARSFLAMFGMRRRRPAPKQRRAS